MLFADVADALDWFRTAMRERPAEEDLVRSVVAALGFAPTEPRLMVEIADLRTQLLRPDRIEKVYRDRQGLMARELRSLLVERGEDELTAAVRAEVVAGAVFGALLVWTETDEPHDLRELGRLTTAALEAVRPALG